MLSVDDPALWEVLSVEAFLAGDPTDLSRVVTDESGLLVVLDGRALLRYARRPPDEVAAARADIAGEVAALRGTYRRVLHAAQRHALDDVVIGLHAWDPIEDAPQVRGLVGAGLIMAMPWEGEPYTGRYRLHPDLPPPSLPPYDFSEAVMPLTDDLGEPEIGPVALLHDMAALAAALHHVEPRRTHAGTLGRVDARKLGRQLGVATIAASGRLEDDRRWSLALRGLEALGAVSLSPITRQLHLDLRLEDTLVGTAAEAIDRLLHRLVDRDQHVLLPAVRAALKAAGGGAVDGLIFAELLSEQHRDILFPAWSREGVRIYPHLEDETPRRYDFEGFETIEQPMVERLLRRIERLGLIRRAPGIFAATEDGQVWSSATDPPRPPVWVSSDLEFMVPPGALTPWERFQLERLGRCLSRDVVDRYILEQKGLRVWLTWHDPEEIFALLSRRCPGVPQIVVDTIGSWTASAMRIVLTRGVRLG